MDQNAVTLGNFSKSGQRFKIDGFALDSFTENITACISTGMKLLHLAVAFQKHVVDIV